MKARYLAPLLSAWAVLAATPASAQGLNPFGNDSNSIHLYSPNGQYLGNLNSNTLDPNSISNPLGPHGSSLAPNSINNPLTYGSPLGYYAPYNPDQQ
jgi:hypothetical protein